MFLPNISNKVIRKKIPRNLSFVSREIKSHLDNSYITIINFVLLQLGLNKTHNYKNVQKHVLNEWLGLTRTTHYHSHRDSQCNIL